MVLGDCGVLLKTSQLSFVLILQILEVQNLRFRKFVVIFASEACRFFKNTIRHDRTANEIHFRG